MKTGYTLSASGLPTIDKAAAAVLDYPASWVDWLQVGETITGAVLVVVTPTGLIVISQLVDATGKIVLLWLSGGTVGVTYRVAITITTNQGRTDTRSIGVAVKLR